MSLPIEIDELIQQLAASLVPPQRHAFIDAARTVLTGVPCLGPGLAFRILVPIQRQFFDPPSDARAVHGPRHLATKLTTRPVIAAVEEPNSVERRRTMWSRR
jgi:hypothetical protein